MKARILTDGKNFRAQIKKHIFHGWKDVPARVYRAPSWPYNATDRLVTREVIELELINEYGRQLVIIPAEWRVC